MNIVEIYEKEIKKFGEHVAVLYEDQKITNVEMDRMAKKFGNALKQLGVERGDRVLIHILNCPEVLQSLQAIWKIGAVAVPVNPLIGKDEAAFIYKDSGAKIIISSSDFLPIIKAHRP